MSPWSPLRVPLTGSLPLVSLMVIASTQNSSQVIAHRLLQLVVAARLRVTVRTPPLELGGVPEPAALHVVVLHLEHPLGPQRGEPQVLAGAPAALRARDPVRVGGEELLPPAPRVLLEGADEGLQLLDQGGPAG